MASYTVLASQSTVQVLSPTLVVDAFQVTIQTAPSDVIANLTLAQSYFDAGQESGFLQEYADGIEAIMAGGKAIAGVGVQTLDTNGLLQEGVEFTVGYTPPNSTTGPLTVTVTVPNASIMAATTGFGGGLILIDRAYDNLILLSGGTPPPPTSTTGGSGSGSGSGTPPPPPPPPPGF